MQKSDPLRRLPSIANVKITRNSSPFTFIASLRASLRAAMKYVVEEKQKVEAKRKKGAKKNLCVCRAQANTLSGKLGKT